MYKRHELHNVPTGSVSEIVITGIGWYLLKEGVTQAEREYVSDTNPRQPRLMTNGRFVLCLAAVIVGASLHPIREYRANGTISTPTVVIAAITLCIGLAIVLAVGWWANRPERGGSNE